MTSSEGINTMGRIIFLDVDGTLVNGDGIIPNSAKYAIKTAKDIAL